MRYPNLSVFAALCASALAPSTEDAARPGRLVEELPTLKCLGVRWWIGGDRNANAYVAVRYRRAGTTSWKAAQRLFRVEPTHMRQRPPAGLVLHAGSIFDLAPGTAYDVELALRDPDGGSTTRRLELRTWREPPRPTRGRTLRAKPGGLRAALRAARPGDVVELATGVYKGSFAPTSGTTGHPIAIVGPSDRSAILDGGNGKTVLSRVGLRHVVFENLTVQNAQWGMAFNEGAFLTVRRCTIRDVEYGFVAQRNGDVQKRILIADNVILGRATWPRSRGIESRRGVQLGGQGHVVCHNRIRGFADAINVASAYPTTAIDFYGNDISECTDDGLEMDFSEHNTRCFDNRFTNVFQGISLQPVHGGPVYVFRNSLYNVVGATFKLNNNPSGGLLYHNTSVKAGMPRVLYSGERVFRTRSRNNLFLGSRGNYAYESTATMVACDFDYDGFGGTWDLFLKWNGVRYRSLAQARRDAPVFRNAVRVDPAAVFASALRVPTDAKRTFPVGLHDTRLAPGSRAVDAGVPLANINDGFSGKAPDLGAHELGRNAPSYGPRSARTKMQSRPPAGATRR